MVEPRTRTMELVRRAQAGDRRSLERILERYYDRVRRIVRIRLSKRLRGALDSSDILQETFMVAAAKIDEFVPYGETSLILWLSKLAEHRITAAADRFGAKKRNLDRTVPLEPATDDDSGDGPHSDPRDRAPTPAEEVADAEQAKIVEACVSELPEPYRELIVLRDYLGAGWADIAARTGRPSEDAARMMHSKARVELARIMRRRMPRLEL
jgi:RNA polymerase sigma-70 factor (ECF subfamily)